MNHRSINSLRQTLRTPSVWPRLRGQSAVLCPVSSCDASRLIQWAAGSSIALALLGGCAVSRAQPDASAEGRVMSIGGEGYVVKQLTSATWTATPQRPAQRGASPTAGGVSTQPDKLQQKAAAQRAIEDASGCKVTDTYNTPGTDQFDAQVDCPGLTN